MATEGLTLTNANVNNGNPIFVSQHREWNEAIAKKINDEPEIENYSGTEWGITEVDTEAITSPTLTFHGVLDIDDSDTTITVNGITATKMTEQLLKQLLVDKDEPTYVHLRLGNTPTFLSKFDGTSVTEITGSLGSYTATSGIKCEIKSININGSPTHKSITTGGSGVRITYSIVLKETV